LNGDFTFDFTKITDNWIKANVRYILNSFADKSAADKDREESSKKFWEERGKRPESKAAVNESMKTVGISYKTEALNLLKQNFLKKNR